MQITSTIVRSVLFAGVIAGLTTSPSAHAQQPTVLNRVHVPFAFRSGSQDYPAGTYMIRITADRFLRIEGGGVTGNAMVQPNPYGTAADEGKLVFTFYGSHHFLEAIWTAGKGAHIDCLKTSEELRLRKEVALASSAKSPARAEVAVLRSME